MLRLLAIFCFCSFCICNTQLYASQYSQKEVDILHIKLNLQFDWNKKQAKGTATIHVVVLKQADNIQLDAGYLTIHSVRSGNNKPLSYQYDGKDKPKGLVIQLDKTYPALSEIILEIDYHTNYVNESDPNNLGGSFGKGIRFFHPNSYTPARKKQLWSNGEGEGNKYWFPCIESINDTRTTELTATVDKELTVISNGKLVDTKLNTNGTKTFHYKTDIAYPNYLTNIIVGEYVKIQQYYNHTAFNTYCYPDEREAAVASANRLTDMAAYFSDYTGIPYPYPHYSQVMVQDYPFPGMTGQHMVSTVSDNFIDDDRTHKDFLYLWDGVEAEALASQWFGNLLSSGSWNDIWLTRSLAHFLEGKYAAQKHGKEEYLMWYHNFDMGAAMGDWKDGNQQPLVVENIEDLNEFVTGSNTLRSRGTLVLRLLELEIGSENMQKCIRLLLKDYAFKSVTTKNFQQVVETVTKKDMNWFFDQWVYTSRQPGFSASYYFDPSRNVLKLTLTQSRQQLNNASYRQVNYFQGNMLIEIDGCLHMVHLKPEAENQFTFPLLQKPAYVNVNYENAWIAEITMQKSMQEYLSQFEKSNDVLARINALNELAIIYKDSGTTSTDREIIYHSMLTIAESEAYWRYKITVLNILNSLLPKPFNIKVKAVLLKIIETEKSWLKANAISVLGNENMAENADLFIRHLNDSSDRVIFNAAVALGKTKSPKAFEALVKLMDKPSWKGQSKMAALTGLRFLGDERAAPLALNILKDNHSPRWFLGAGGWDYPVYAATTLSSLNKGSLGYEIILNRFDKAMQGNDINDVFNNVLLISILADPRGTAVFERLKIKYEKNANALKAVNTYEEQFKNAIKR